MNLPGLKLIQYAPTNWINPATYEKILSDSYNWQYDIPFQTGDWLTMPLLSNQRPWNESQRNSPNGPYFEQQLSGVIPNLRPDVSGEFDAMTQYKFILKLEDRNGKTWLLGTLDHPFQFVCDGSAGAGSGALNNYSIQFISQTPHRAYGFIPVL
jgi:hypothetical protein